MRVKITQPVSVRANDEGTVIVNYDAGHEGVVPHHHAEQIKAAKVGHEVDPPKAAEESKIKK